MRYDAVMDGEDDQKATMDLELRRELLKACKVDEAVGPEDPRHFDFDRPELHLRGRPWREQVCRVIHLSDGPTSQLVTGLPGSGKTTELRSVKHDLEELGYRVVLADAGPFLRDDEPISVAQILLALVLGLFPEGQPEGVTGWLGEYRQRAWTFLTSKVEIEGLERSLGPVDVKLRLEKQNTLFQQAARKLQEVRGLADEVAELLGKAARDSEEEGSPLVLLLDGIEKRATGDLLGPEEREKYRNHWFGAFLTRAAELRPPLHVVYAVPPFMTRRAAQLGNQFGHELQFLPMVRLFDRERGSNGEVRLHGEGLEAMVEALFQRVPSKHFTEKAVAAWLAVYSGGYMRDLLRLVNDCLYNLSGLRIDRELADAAIIQMQQTYYEGWEAGYDDLLGRVHDDRTFPLDDRNRDQMDTLLQGYMMMRYHNARCWYDVHPLVWPRLGVRAPTWQEVAEACP